MESGVGGGEGGKIIEAIKGRKSKGNYLTRLRLSVSIHNVS